MKNINKNQNCHSLSKFYLRNKESYHKMPYLAHAQGMTGESGRSMVEMLGVLAVIGVLSVGGIAGYKTAMTKHQANELLNEASKRAVVVAAKIASGQFNASTALNEFVGQDTQGTSFTVEKDGNYFNLKTTKQFPKEICKEIAHYSGNSSAVRAVYSGTTLVSSSDNCQNNQTITFSYNSDFSTSGSYETPGRECTTASECGAGECWECNRGHCVLDDSKCANGETCSTGGQCLHAECVNPDCSCSYRGVNVDDCPVSKPYCSMDEDENLQCSTSYEGQGCDTNGDCEGTDAPYCVERGSTAGICSANPAGMKCDTHADCALFSETPFCCQTLEEGIHCCASLEGTYLNSPTDDCKDDNLFPCLQADLYVCTRAEDVLLCECTSNAQCSAWTNGSKTYCGKSLDWESGEAVGYPSCYTSGAHFECSSSSDCPDENYPYCAHSECGSSGYEADCQTDSDCPDPNYPYCDTQGYEWGVCYATGEYILCSNNYGSGKSGSCPDPNFPTCVDEHCSS